MHGLGYFQRSAQILKWGLKYYCSAPKPLKLSTHISHSFSAATPARPRNEAQARTTHPLLLRLLTCTAPPILFFSRPDITSRCRSAPQKAPRMRRCLPMESAANHRRCAPLQPRRGGGAGGGRGRGGARHAEWSRGEVDVPRRPQRGRSIVETVLHCA
jgi:hypothetical protein